MTNMERLVRFVTQFELCTMRDGSKGSKSHVCPCCDLGLTNVTDAIVEALRNADISQIAFAKALNKRSGKEVCSISESGVLSFVSESTNTAKLYSTVAEACYYK